MEIDMGNSWDLHFTHWNRPKRLEKNGLPLLINFEKAVDFISLKFIEKKKN